MASIYSETRSPTMAAHKRPARDMDNDDRRPLSAQRPHHRRRENKIGMDELLCFFHFAPLITDPLLLDCFWSVHVFISDSDGSAASAVDNDEYVLSVYVRFSLN